MTLEELRDKAHSLSQTPRGVWVPGDTHPRRTGIPPAARSFLHKPLGRAGARFAALTRQGRNMVRYWHREGKA